MNMEKWRGNLLVTLKAGEVGFSRLEKKNYGKRWWIKLEAYRLLCSKIKQFSWNKKELRRITSKLK